VIKPNITSKHINDEKMIEESLHDDKFLIGGGSVVREQLFPLRQRLFPFVSLTSICNKFYYRID